MSSSPTTFDGAFSRHHAAVEAMRKRVEPLGDGSLASEESPATTRRRLLAGRVIRQLPLPPASATLEPAVPALEDEASMPSSPAKRSPRPLLKIHQPELPSATTTKPPGGSPSRKAPSPRAARLESATSSPEHSHRIVQYRPLYPTWSRAVVDLWLVYRGRCGAAVCDERRKLL